MEKPQMKSHSNLESGQSPESKESNGLFRRRKKRPSPRVQWQNQKTAAEDAARPGPKLAEPSDDKKGLQTTREKIMSFVNAHKSYTPPGLTESVTGQPEFDDVSRYGITEEQEEQLRQLETERLISAVETSQGTQPFRLTVKDKWPANKTYLEHLSALADQAMCNISVCNYDNQIVLYEHKQELFDSEAYFTAQRNVQQFCDSQKPSQPSKPSKSGKPVPKSETKPAMTSEQSRELYCALIDYVTAVAARYACNAIPNEFWHTRALAGLAKCAAKLKFLMVDPEKFANQSLEDGEDVLALDDARQYIGNPQQQPEMDMDPTDFHGARRDYRELSSTVRNAETLLRGSYIDTSIYYTEMSMSSTWSLDTMWAIFRDLKGGKLSGYAVDAFDICSIVYKTGWNEMPALLSQNRDGEIRGYSTRSYMRTLYEAFRIIRQAADTIAAEQAAAKEARDPAAPTTAADVNGGAHLIFTMQDNDGGTGVNEGASGASGAGAEVVHLSLDTIADVVSIMVPMLVTQTGALYYLNWAFGFVAGISSISSSIDFSSLPIIKFSAFSSLRVRAYDQIQTSAKKVDFRPVSRSLLAQERLHTFGRVTNTSSTIRWDAQTTESRRQALHEAEVKLQELDRTVRSWVIEEKTIIVMRRPFVVAIMTLCGVLVVGGILAGILMGERLKGVDPFNITTFAWVLAGFILLVAKSLFVREWPWRDFLRGRVPCRSVSELHTVTGVDAQDIMEYLLAKESYTILITKGPFNRAFTRQSAEGFSIDEKMELRTLVASGIIVVKVATQLGPALVCLDIRRGAEGRTSIQHSGGAEKDERLLGCFDFPEAFDDNEEAPLQTLTEAMTWTRILGVYHRPFQKFR